MATSARAIKLISNKPHRERGLIVAFSNSNHILLSMPQSILEMGQVVKSSRLPLDPIAG